MITYEEADDVKTRATRIAELLHLSHIDLSRLYFYRSRGSRARHVQARIHGMGRIWFQALRMQPNYIVEVISEEFDSLDEAEKDKVIIHELMHIPRGFSGGFVPHRGKITRRKVEAMYKNYSDAKGSPIS